MYLKLLFRSRVCLESGYTSVYFGGTNTHYTPNISPTQHDHVDSTYPRLRTFLNYYPPHSFSLSLNSPKKSMLYTRTGDKGKCAIQKSRSLALQYPRIQTMADMLSFAPVCADPFKKANHLCTMASAAWKLIGSSRLLVRSMNSTPASGNICVCYLVTKPTLVLSLPSFHCPFLFSLIVWSPISVLLGSFRQWRRRKTTHTSTSGLFMATRLVYFVARFFLCIHLTWNTCLHIESPTITAKSPPMV